MIKDHIYDKDLLVILSIPSLEGEEWRSINRTVYPNIKPVYWVSSKARIYNAKTKKFITTRKLDETKHSSPYYKVNLQITINGHSYSDVFLVHRLMMCAFFPVEGMEDLLVNHKDGDKCNDELSNLEWMTPSENVKHALKLGLFNPVYGENHCCATISEETAKKIIEMLLSRKYTHREIAEKMNCSRAVVEAISSRKAWKHLTNELDFSSLRYRIPKDFTYDEIRLCCKYFSEHPKEEDKSVRRYCMECLKGIGYKRPITEAVINSIRLVYAKKRYQHISKDYNF